MTLPADKYLIEALEATGTRHPLPCLADIKAGAGSWAGTIAHARALERIAELEACLKGQAWTIDTLTATLDQALAKLAQYEPRVDPDLALARDVAEKWFDACGCPRMAEQACSGGLDHTNEVQCALAGIKAGRAEGGL